MNLVQNYIGMEETKEYYKIRPRQIIVPHSIYWNKWFIFTKFDDLFCGMTPEKFIRIVTDNGTIRHSLDKDNVPIFDECSNCTAACRLLHIYLYRRDYVN